MIVGAVESLLEEADPELELIIVDQSDSDETERVLAPWLGDARVRYLRSTKIGKGAALNEGLSHATGAVVAFTDDDCRVPPNWVGRMASILDQHSDCAILFCRVIAVPHDHQAGYVPTYDP